MKDFSRDKGVRKESYTKKQQQQQQKESYTSKEHIGCGMVTVLERTAVVYQADDLTSTNQVISDWEV